MKVASKKYCKLLYFIAGYALGIGALSIYPFPLSEPGTIIETRHMFYACGDCYAQERVTRVFDKENGKLTDKANYESENNMPLRYLGWDVVVNYKGNTDGLLEYLGTTTKYIQNCAWPDFRLKGQFKRRLIYALYFRGDHYDGIYFDTNDATAIYLSGENCPIPAGEVTLP